MQRAVGIVLDFDNLLLNTTELKSDLKLLIHQSFPKISSELYEACYAEYRVFHYGRTHMQKILATVAERASCTETETHVLVHEWLASLPYDQYVFPGARELLASLDPHRSFIFTKSEDAAYQQRKIEACHLPILSENIIISEEKTQKAFDGLFSQLSERGITLVIAGSDEAIELIRGYGSAQTMGMQYEGIHHRYGEYWRNDLPSTAALGSHYHPAEDFTSFAHILTDYHQRLEGQIISAEGTLPGKERI